jgi:hypothetical protein
VCTRVRACVYMDLYVLFIILHYIIDHCCFIIIIIIIIIIIDRLCGLVVRVLDYRCRGPGFDSRALQKSSGSGTGSTQPREYN